MSVTASCGHRRPRVAANPHQCSAYGMAVGQCLNDVSRISRSPGFFSSLLEPVGNTALQSEASAARRTNPFPNR